MSDDNNDDGGENFEVQATALGWVPQDKFRGSSDKWVDAKTFVEKGRRQMPILLENNRRMATELAQVRGTVAQLQTLVQAGSESMEELKKFHSDDVKRAIIRERERLSSKLKDIRENGTVEEELEIHEEIANLNDMKKAAEAAGKPNGPGSQQQVDLPQPQQVDPDFVLWQQQPENDWFGKDKRKTNLALGIADEMRSDPKNRNLRGYDFYEKVTEELNKYLGVGEGEQNGRREDKVSGARPSGQGGGSGGGKKTYAALPADAKTTCDSQSKKFVGAGRAFKTQAEWQAYYAEQYFRGE